MRRTFFDGDTLIYTYRLHILTV